MKLGSLPKMISFLSLSLSLSLSNCNGICYLFSCMLQYLSLILDVYACMKVTQICSVLLLLLISIVIFGCVVWLCSFFRGSFIWLNARYQYWVNLIYCCCVYDSGSATQCYGLYLEQDCQLLLTTMYLINLIFKFWNIFFFPFYWKSLYL